VERSFACEAEVVVTPGRCFFVIEVFEQEETGRFFPVGNEMRSDIAHRRGVALRVVACAVIDACETYPANPF